ncbi:MAG: O-antigen ligase family protein [Nitrospirae bacterium]|nr:O-antigen ligase family protein [Nitrospirota bacterium]
MLIFCVLLLSYLMSGQDISKLFSYAFIRYNGSIFFCFVPLLALLFLRVNTVTLARVFFFMTFLMSAVICLLGLLEFFAGRSTFLLKDDGIGLMFVGLNRTHNATGSITALLGIAALVFTVFVEESRVRFRYLIYALVFYTALMLTLSRGSLMAFFLAACFLFACAKLKFKKKILLPIAALLITSAVMTPITHSLDRVKALFNDQFYRSDQTNAYRVASLISPPITNQLETLRILCDPRYPLDRNNTAKYRKLLTEYAIELFKESPIIGIGFGRFDDSILSQVGFSGKKHWVYLATSGEPVSTDCNAHNSYLHFLAEIGLVGTLIIVGFWLKILADLYEGIRVAADHDDRVTFAVGFMSVFTLFLLAFTEHYFAAPTVMLFVSYVTGLCLNRLAQIRQEYSAVQ